MKPWKIGLLMMVTSLVLSGCLYVHTEAPGLVQAVTEYQLTSNDFKILGRVRATGETTFWFWSVALGGQGYQALLKEAQAMGGDEIMNYSFDIEEKSVLFFIYAHVQWKATGLAIKYTDHVKP